LEQVWGRDLQALGRFGRVLRALPENGGAPLGRDHGVVAELEDEHAIGDAERERAAGATLADDGGDDRDADPGHHLERDADGLALPALLRADAGERAHRVDERDDGKPEAIGELVEPYRLAVSLGVRHPEVPLQVLLRRASLLVADDDDAPPVVAREPAHDGWVVGEAPIAVQLDEVREQALDVIERVRAVRVPRELHLLHRAQLAEDLTCELRGLLLEALELATETIVGARQLPELPDAGDELHHRAFEGENVGHVRRTLTERSPEVERPSARLPHRVATTASTAVGSGNLDCWPRAFHVEDTERTLLAAELGRRELLNVELSPEAGQRRFTDQDLTGPGDPAEPRARVHRVADDRVAERLAAPDVPGDQRARVDADADRERQEAVLRAPVVEPLEHFHLLEGAGDGEQRIVRVHDRGTPQGHDPVAHELVERAFEFEHRLDHQLEILVQELDERLR